MKVVVNEKPNQEKKYPWLGIYSSKVVLFHADRVGILLVNDYCHQDNVYCGHYKNTWDEDMFEPFEGEIVLSNS